MVTTPEAEEPEPTPTAVIARQALEAARTVVAGSPVGSIRRIVLYSMVGASIGVEAGSDIFDVPTAVFGLICVILLIATDDLR